MRFLRLIILTTTLATTGYSQSPDTVSVSKKLVDTLTIQPSDTTRLIDNNKTTIIISTETDKDIYDYLAIIISSIIGVLAYLIGHKQVATQKYQIRLDLLERRMKNEDL